MKDRLKQWIAAIKYERKRRQRLKHDCMPIDTQILSKEQELAERRGIKRL